MSGQKHDQDKNRLELVSADFVEAILQLDPDCYEFDRWAVIHDIKRWAECSNHTLCDIAVRIAAGINRSTIGDDWLTALGKVLTFGAKKYSAWNWSEGLEWSRLVGAAMRHVHASAVGDGRDEETGFPHLWHALCCLMFLYVHELRGLGTDDRKHWGPRRVFAHVRVTVAAEPERVFIDGDTAEDWGGRAHDPQPVVENETIRAAQDQTACVYCGCVRNIHLQSCASQQQSDAHAFKSPEPPEQCTHGRAIDEGCVRCEDWERYTDYYDDTPDGHPSVEQGYRGPGWYYWDETLAYCHGPYADRDSVHWALEQYAKTL